MGRFSGRFSEGFSGSFWWALQINCGCESYPFDASEKNVLGISCFSGGGGITYQVRRNLRHEKLACMGLGGIEKCGSGRQLAVKYNLAGPEEEFEDLKNDEVITTLQYKQRVSQLLNSNGCVRLGTQYSSLETLLRGMLRRG